MRTRICLAIAVLILAAANKAFAQESPKQRKFYASAALGGFFEKSNPGHFANQDGNFSGYVSAGWRFHPHMAFEVELFGYSQKVDTPSGFTPSNGTTDSRASIDVAGIIPQIKFIWPVQNVDLFLGGGLGFFSSAGEISGTVNGVDFFAREYDTIVGGQITAGADFRFFERYSVGLEGRRIWHKANLGNFSNGKVDLGGSAAMINFRIRF